MTIAELRENCKARFGKIPRDYLIVGILVLSASLSFLFGYFAGQEAGQRSGASPEASSAPVAGTGGQVVASKNGTKYYPPDCSGASRISDANKVWFASASAAEEAGYSAAANCTAK